ncbi:MAG: FAD-dependent oxidoreductase [Candidatus Lokiarchaeota archaeon]|nr:FAD-dependent oxidoreductase [Candidatus Lokiarchaeota archaeon]
MTESKQNKINEIVSSNPVFQKAIASSNYCYNCNRCVNVCPQAADGRFSPRNVISDLTLLSIEEAVENTNTWHCLTCGLCMEYCPMSLKKVGVDIIEIILNLRTLTNDLGIMQVQKASCQHGRSFSNIPELMVDDKIEITNKLGFLEESNVKISDKGDVGYFMGCLPFMGGIAPCSQACPAGLDVQGYVALIKEGKFQEALDLIRERNPFPVVCGRVCTHPCELSCNRKDVDDPVAIRALKRFVADWEMENKSTSSIKPIEQTKDKVAIVGAGPAGLTAAYYLARKGYKPTVFEEGSQAGGRLRSGIPEYRLPQSTLDYEIDFIKKMGVDIQTNTLIGPSLTFDDLRNQGYKAFYISVGLGNSRELGVKGDDIKNVFYGLKFLEEQSLGLKKHKFKDRVVGIVGGGNVAIDSARTALRLGAKKVIVIYRRSEKEMPALEEEIEAAKYENIEFQFLTNPYQIISDKKGSCSEVECIRMELGEPDASGRQSPVEIKGSQFRMNIDVLIAAIGQVPELTLLKAAEPRLETNKWGYVDYDDTTFETKLPGVFIGGDVLGGNGVAITAIANGYEAAESINRYLSGVDLKKGRIKRAKYKFSPIPKKEIKPVPREPMKELESRERVKNFDEIELGFSEEQAIREANRCLNCSSCSSCDQFVGMTAQKCGYGSNPSLLYSKSVDYLNIPKVTISLMNQKDIVPVVLATEKCCGHDLYWNGEFAAFEKLARHNVKIYKDAGVKTLVFSCAEGYCTWKNQYKKLFGKEFDFEILHITEYIIKERILEDVSFPVHDKITVTYHDPCRLGRMSGVYDAPRDVFNYIPFVELVEMKNNRNLSSCCGVSAYLSCNENSKTLQGKRIKEAIETGADYLIVSCPKCLAHLNCYIDEHPELAEKIKIKDLTSFLGDLLLLK